MRSAIARSTVAAPLKTGMTTDTRTIARQPSISITALATGSFRGSSAFAVT